MNSADLIALPPAFTSHEGWTVGTFAELGSTNTHAGALPAWHAVRAATQLAGRGRTGRHWVSDEGGLWLSAVVPCPGVRARWSILPLAAGWAIIHAMGELGVPDLRLRWPNDIMCGRRKLAGLLVERFSEKTAVIGLGLNVTNSPEEADPSLRGITIRLADLMTAPPSLDDLARLVLRSVRRAQALVANDEFRRISDELNLGWAQPRRVAVSLASPERTFEGRFLGVDAFGRLRVSTATGGEHLYDATQVALLRELD